MSDMMVNRHRNIDDLDEEEEEEPMGRGLSLTLPPSHTHKSTGKGRFAHRKHQKSKSLCTLETNLDEVEGGGEEGEDNLRRVPSVHELRVTKSLQKLNVPDWFKQSSLSKSSSCLLKYGSNSTMNSFSLFSPSLISSPCASTAPPAPNVVIRTRVVPPSNPRVLRTPQLYSTTAPSSVSSVERKMLSTPVKLPSERLREKEKNKNLMPIPIVPFAQIRAMFEKKGKEDRKKKGTGAEKPAQVSPAAHERSTQERSSPQKHVVLETREVKSILKVSSSSPPPPKPTPPSVSISTMEEGKKEEERIMIHHEYVRPTSPRRSAFEKPPVSPKRTSSPPPPPPVAVAETVTTSFQPQRGSLVIHGATNGVTHDPEANSVSRTVSSKTESFPPSVSTSRSQKPPISPTEPKPWNPEIVGKNASGKDSSSAQPKSPPKDSKPQAFSPSRSLRQFFGRSKDRSSEKKPAEESRSPDTSFSSGDGYYEQEPRRLGSGRKSHSSPPSSLQQRSDPDSSFSSGGEGLFSRTQDRSLEGAPPSRTSRTSGGPRTSYTNSEQDWDRPQPPFSRFAPQEDGSQPSVISDGEGQKEGSSKVEGRVPEVGMSFGHTSMSSENGDHVPESSSSSAADGGDKKSVKETTV